MSDDFGNRMKRYENASRFILSRRIYTLIRIDGRAFHTYTRKCDRPFDPELIKCMNAAAMYAIKDIQGAQFAYTQSDEITILVTDFANTETDLWFDGNIQKIASISASLATCGFIKCIVESLYNQNKLPLDVQFDARVWQIADPVEVANAIIWRQKDAERNSLSMLCESNFSSKELHGKTNAQRQDMLYNIGLNWNDLPAAQKRGRMIRKNEDRKWFVDNEIPIFTQNREWLTDLIPMMNEINNE